MVSVGVPITRWLNKEEFEDQIKLLRLKQLFSIEISFTRCVLGTGNPQRGLLPYPSMQRVQEIADIVLPEFSISIHMPYSTTLTSSETAKQSQTKAHFTKCGKIAKVLNASHLTFHCGSNIPTNAKELVIRGINEAKKRAGNVLLAPEVAGKKNQFSDFQTLVNIAQETETVITWDLAHDFARGGAVTNLHDLEKRFEMLNDLNFSVKGKLPIHLSGIIGGPKGEKKHTNLRASATPWKLFLSVLQEQGYSNRSNIICESRGMIHDIPASVHDACLIKDFLEKGMKVYDWDAPKDRLEAFF